MLKIQKKNKNSYTLNQIKALFYTINFKRTFSLSLSLSVYASSVEQTVISLSFSVIEIFGRSIDK